MLNIHHVKSYQRAEESNIDFCELFPQDVWSSIGGCEFLEQVQSREDGREVLFVGGLVGSETCFVDSCVEVSLENGGEGVDLRLKGRRVE